MSRRNLFSVNRWPIGADAAVDADSKAVLAEILADAAERGKRNRKRWDRYERKAELRGELMRQNPFCSCCGDRVQSVEPDGADYACVLAQSRQLICRTCMEADVESEVQPCS